MDGRRQTIHEGSGLRGKQTRELHFESYFSHGCFQVSNTWFCCIQAGIPGDNLSLAYESEVAAVYCRHLPKKMLVGLRGRDLLQSFNKGRKFMVLDLGGKKIVYQFHNKLKSRLWIEIL